VSEYLRMKASWLPKTDATARIWRKQDRREFDSRAGFPRDMREPRRFAIRVLHWGKPTPGIDAVTRLCLAVLA
jgi:hypothetical protein